MNKKLSSGISLFLFIFCFCISGLTEQLQIDTVYKDKADEVSFVVTLPPGLEISPKSSDFQLLDGSKVIKKNANAIETFRGSNRDLVLLFNVDVSGSINKATLKETQDALINILSEKTLQKDKYQFGVLSFADKVINFPGFTDNQDTFTKSIRELKTARGKKAQNTVLFEAIIDSLNRLEQHKPNEYRRILVISDGKDEGSTEAFDTVVNLSKKLGIPIDGIAIGRDRRQFDGTDGLNGLAKATGGRFIDPRAESMSIKEAVTRSLNSFIENTWIVHFRYQSDTEKPALENAQIKFSPNETIDISAVFSGNIPAPQVNPPNPRVESGNDKKFNQSTGYWAIGILLLITLIFIVWIIRRNQEKPDVIDNGKIDPIIKSKEPIEDTVIPAPQSQSTRKIDRRHTVISPDPKLNHSYADKPGIALEIIEGSQAGQKFPITKSTFRIGANTDNDLVLLDNYVSRNHASLSYVNGQLLLTDQSRNGTTINGVLINNDTSIITPGDEIRVGNTSLKVIEM